MNKQLEQLAIVAVLGATAFILWRAYRNGLSLGALGNMTGANAATLTAAQRYNVIRPSADSLIDSVWGTSGSGGGTGSSGVTLSNGTLYTAGSDPGYSAGA